MVKDWKELLKEEAKTVGNRTPNVNYDDKIKVEMVNHPQHYGGEDNLYECIKVLKAWLTKEEFDGFCKGNTLKYLARAGKKDATLQEYKKAAWYLNELIKNND